MVAASGVRAQQASPPKTPQVAAPAEEPPYDPATHGGYSEGAWLRATRGLERRSTGMMATGIVLITLGASLVAIGTGVALGGRGCNAMSRPTAGGGAVEVCGAITGPTTGLAVGSAGVITLGLGLPLTILGAMEVPPVEAARASPPLRLSLLRVSMRPEGPSPHAPSPLTASPSGLRSGSFAIMFGGMF